MRKLVFFLLVPVVAVGVYMAISGRTHFDVPAPVQQTSAEQKAPAPKATPTIRWTAPAEILPSGRLRLAFKAESSSPLRILQIKIGPATSVPGMSMEAELHNIPTWLMGNKSIDWDGEVDLTSSLLAGQTTSVQIVAVDDDSRIGTSESATLALPERQFSQPLASALYTLRKSLYEDPAKRGQALKALASLLQQRGPFENQDLTLLTLRSAAVRIALDDSRDGLKSALDLLWHAARLFEENPSNVTVSLRLSPDRPPEVIKPE
jgi:hypothetical protein